MRGKLAAAIVRQVCKEDHPRGCGENIDCRAPHGESSGSPPRMRGKHPCFFVKAFAYRITPADAGKTGFALKNIFVDWDHPRGCGENQQVRI